MAPFAATPSKRRPLETNPGAEFDDCESNVVLPRRHSRCAVLEPESGKELTAAMSPKSPPLSQRTLAAQDVPQQRYFLRSRSTAVPVISAAPAHASPRPSSSACGSRADNAFDATPERRPRGQSFKQEMSAGPLTLSQRLSMLPPFSATPEKTRRPSRRPSSPGTPAKQQKPQPVVSGPAALAHLSDIEEGEDEAEASEATEEDSDGESWLFEKKTAKRKSIRAAPKKRAKIDVVNKTPQNKKEEPPAKRCPAHEESEEKAREKHTRPKHAAPMHKFEDPAGMSPNDFGVEAIVRSQLGKVLPLLRSARESGDLPATIRIGTACSGTDSPVLGAILDMEALEAAGYAGVLNFQHVMSCEIEPFKQAFLARNYPNSVLLPDIRKLVPEDGSRHTENVVGVRVEVPCCDVFIAGTVCKDFSMRKTRYRLDLEDNGKSGQTFFAAVEYIFDREIKFSIFENVCNSPWEKMKEYITGILHLESLTKHQSGGKKISSAKTQGTQESELIFTLQEDGKLEVVQVARTAGVRLGAKLLSVRNRQGQARSAVLPRSSGFKVGDQIELSKLWGVLRLSSSDALVFDTVLKGFHAHKMKVDSKRYGLPQTRERGYMLVWHESQGGEELGPLWEHLVRLMEHPLRHSLSEFLLPDEDERVRRFREVLRGSLGRRAKEEIALTYGGDWWNSGSKDVARAKKYKADLGHDAEVRTVTNWGPQGHFKGQPAIWPEMLAVINSRQRDLIESFTAECAAEEVPRDPLHSSYVWDISQNVGIASPYNRPGVTGCLTPGGWMLMPDRGRCMLGYEKLICQGIPVSRLALGMESEVQLSDLAGNAMSLPVVNSCLLAALAVKELAHLQNQRQPCCLKRLRDAPPLEPLEASSGAAPGAMTPQEDAYEAFARLARLSFSAEASSILCSCESSGSISGSEIICCRGCGLSICRSCAMLTNTESHEHSLTDRVGALRPKAPGGFQQRLRKAAPQRLLLPSAASEQLHPEKVAADVAFSLTQVKRGRGHWMLRYVPEAERRPSAELKLFVGFSHFWGGFKGLRAEIRFFTDANREDARVPPAARLLLPLTAVASMRPPFRSRDDVLQPVWEKCGTPEEVDLKLRYTDLQRSYRAELGLKEFQSELWPGKVHISTSSCGLSGSYDRMPCRGTCNQGALWQRQEGQKKAFLYLRANVNRIGLDMPTLAESPLADEADCFTLAALDTSWSPASRLGQVKALRPRWEKKPSVQLHTLNDVMLRRIYEHSSSLDAVAPTASARVVRLNMPPAIMSNLIPGCRRKWQVLKPEGARGGQHLRRFMDSVASTLLKKGIPKALKKWQKMDGSNWGNCPVSAPRAPKARWKGNGTRCYDHEESVDFELRMRHRPKIWRVEVRCRSGRASSRFSVLPVSAAHRAAAALQPCSASKDKHIFCDWRIAEPSQDLDAETSSFQVPNSNAFKQEPTPSALKACGKELYERQARALRRMLDIEAGLVEFTEEERSEHQLPGVSWLMEARARSTQCLPGGVLADQMGGGKTVTTLALVASDIDRAHQKNSADVIRGQSKATLILCPPSLVGQWNAERKEFTGCALKAVIIEKAEHLSKVSVRMLQEADVVIASFELLAEDAYLTNLSRKSGFQVPKFPGGQAGHQEPDHLRGIWLPGHPASPYEEHKGKQVQRELAAHFSMLYREAVLKLREQKLSPDDMCPPLEYFQWRRVVMDEVHMAFGSSKENVKSHRAARELLGVAQPEVHQRPLRAAVGIWGLTGTPMLSDERRITEMASLCGGVYVMSARTHWRNMERASIRDQFLLAQEPAQTTQYRRQSRCHAQNYVSTAFQQNRIDKFELTKLEERVVRLQMTGSDVRRYTGILAKMGSARDNDLAPPKDSMSEQTWEQLLHASALATARSNGLGALLEEVRQREGRDTKFIVFADAGGPLEAARRALSAVDAEGFVEPSEDGDYSKVHAFAQMDITVADRARPRVLLLAFDQAAGFNLQYACHHAVLFSPLSREDPVQACAQEQQAIGRIHRPGQKKDVHVHRLVLQGPKGQDTIDAALVKQNTDEALMQQATSNACRDSRATV
eukprot:TRINITY_DN27914_c0_g2_i1.p1 TRINITY_DN27914_c0_g2~~TRINITY_DN27914_c0_g2_i1.p1  ORF type:complete len:2094 (+),score=462.88 TRINITY_DN27914_c0_g2_i1:118-6282(+)